MQVAADRVFELLYRRHRVELYRWLLRETGDPEVAEDVVQTAFLQAYRALLRGDPPREPRAWLFAIARNANRSRFRRDRVSEAELDEDMPLAREESLASELREALAVLPPAQRAAILLQEVAGLSYAEIAERLGVTIGSVQMLVFRARRRLRAELLGEREVTRLLLPLQPLLNALSRVGSAGDGGLLLRGAAGLAGAVAIGGSVLAGPGDGDASTPAHAARGAAEASALVRASPTRGAARGRPASVAFAAVRSVRHHPVPGQSARLTRRATAVQPAPGAPDPQPTPAPGAAPTPASQHEPAAEPRSAPAVVPERTSVTAAAPSTASAVGAVIDATAAAAPVPPVTAPEVTVPALPMAPPAVPTVPLPSSLPVVPSAVPVAPPAIPAPTPGPPVAP